MASLYSREPPLLASAHSVKFIPAIAEYVADPPTHLKTPPSAFFVKSVNQDRSARLPTGCLWTLSS